MFRQVNRRQARSAVAAFASLALCGAALALTGPLANNASAATASPIKTTFVVMMENTDWSVVKGSRSFPYFNSLLPKGAHTENYRSGLHPSLPNYVTLEAGKTFGETNGSNLPSDHPINSTAHLTTQLSAAGVDWKYWAESLPGNGATCNTSDPGTPYSLDHNAQVYFNDVRNNPSYCKAHERPYSGLSGALRSNSVSGYNLIVPNDYDQGEKLAPGSGNMLRQADKWLSHEIPMIQASSAYKNGAAIMILWDEGGGTDTNPSGLLVLSPFAKVNYSNSIAYSHASTLRTMQTVFRVGPLLGAAANANDLSDLFTVPLVSSSGPTTTTVNTTPVCQG